VLGSAEGSTAANAIIVAYGDLDDAAREPVASTT
jgi:hypothetical protein